MFISRELIYQVPGYQVVHMLQQICCRYGCLMVMRSRAKVE